MDRTEAALRPGLFVGAAPFGRRRLIELLRRSIESARAQARPAQRRARAGAVQSRLVESLERRTPRAAAPGAEVSCPFHPCHTFADARRPHARPLVEASSR